jgi:tetratricopeptide (TPR) repeat protein
MSLIRDAIREMDHAELVREAETLPHCATHDQPQERSSRRTILLSLLALALLLLLGIGGYWAYTQRQADSPSSDTVQAPIMAQLPQEKSVAQSLPPAAPPAQASPETPEKQPPQAAITHEPPAKTETPTLKKSAGVVPQLSASHAADKPARTPAQSPLASAQKPARTPAQTPPLAQSLPKTVAEGSADEALQTTIEQSHALLNKALAKGDTHAARNHLETLEKLLPPESITLLRARAWFLTQTGDTEAAGQNYRSILMRLPDDENARLNLAVLESMAGRTDVARDMLTTLLREHPESKEAQQTLERLNKGRR